MASSPSSGGPFATVRIERIDDLQAAGAETRHGRREGDLPHVDRSRSHLNRVGSDIAGVTDPTDVAECIKAAAKVENAKFRKGASVAFSAMCIGSAEYFRPDNPGRAGTWREDRLEPWVDRNLNELRKRFGPIAYWRLDLDETTPHLIAVFVPVSARKTKGGKPKREVSVRDAIGGHRERMTEIQDWYATAMAPLGLRRGVAKEDTGAVRRDVGEMYGSMKDDLAAAAEARKQAEEERRKAEADANSIRNGAREEGAKITDAARADAVGIVGRANEEGKESRASAERYSKRVRGDADEHARKVRAGVADAIAAAEVEKAAAQKAREAADRDREVAAALTREASEDREQAAKEKTKASDNYKASTLAWQRAESLKTRREEELAAAKADRDAAATARAEAITARTEARSDRSAAAALKEEAEATKRAAEVDWAAAATAKRAAEADRLVVANLRSQAEGVLREAREKAVEKAMVAVQPVLDLHRDLTEHAKRVFEEAGRMPPAIQNVARGWVARVGEFVGEKLSETFGRIGTRLEPPIERHEAIWEIRAAAQKAVAPLAPKTPPSPPPAAKAPVAVRKPAPPTR